MYVDGGTLTLEGGTITGNVANASDHNAYGGGVYVSGGAFIMNGGEICDNLVVNGRTTEKLGGGVYVSNGSFTLNGGAITDNTAGTHGGGLYVSGGTFNVAGNPVIQNNWNNTQVDNVYLTGSWKVNVAGPLGSDCLIGVRTPMPGVFTTNLSANGVADNFSADADDFVVCTESDGEASLTYGAKVEFLSGGEVILRLKVRTGRQVPRPDDPTRSGCAFRGWYQLTDGDVVSEEPFDFSTAITEAITLQAQWEEVEYGTPDFTLPAGITLIEGNAFEGIDARIVYILDGCTEIGPYAFKDCANLEQIRIPSGCAIDEFAFEGCENVYIFSTPGGGAEQYCQHHDNCTFIEEQQE